VTWTAETLTERWDSLTQSQRDGALRALARPVDRGAPNPYALSLTLRIAWRSYPQDRPRLVVQHGHPDSYPGGTELIYREDRPEEDEGE